MKRGIKAFLYAHGGGFRGLLSVVALFLFTVTMPVHAQTFDPRSELDTQGGVVFGSAGERKREDEETFRQRRIKPESTGIRYRPFESDPTTDPLDPGYQAWLKTVKEEAANDFLGRDKEYESFIREMSGLLFSLSDEKLSKESREFLESIPAGVLESAYHPLEPKHSATIERGGSADPFPVITGEMDEYTDVGLKISIKENAISDNKLLGMAYDALLSGQVDAAGALYRRLLVQDPDNTQAMFGLATAYQRGGQIGQAKDVYIQLISQDSSNWGALNNFLLLVSEEAPEDALKELNKLEQRNPEFAPIPAHIGMIYIKKGEIETAAKYFTRAVILSPDNLHYRYNLAVLFDHMGQTNQAVRLYGQLLAEGQKGKELPESMQHIKDRMTYIASKNS